MSEYTLTYKATFKIDAVDDVEARMEARSLCDMYLDTSEAELEWGDMDAITKTTLRKKDRIIPL